MSALDRVRKKFGNLGEATDKADKRASVSSVSSSPQVSEKFGGSFTPGLEARITAMATRWQYTAADLTEALQCAAADPAAWLAAVQWDEEQARSAERAGRQHPPERFA